MIQAANELAERVSTISVSSTMKVAADADKLRREGADVVDFGAGEPDFPTPDNIKQAAVRALEANFTKYTPVGGILELKKAICERHATDYGTSYSPAECIVTVGGKHIIFNLTQVLLNPGDEVIVPVPYWVTYKDVINYAGAKCVFVETSEANGFTPTAADIEEHITPKTKLVIINSPCNPSGGRYHYCPAISGTDSVGYRHRPISPGSRRAGGPVKWAFSQKGSRSKSVEFGRG
jgi:aspartate aminotransferase